jgi:cyclophilin family peptidyl-prolyl cis-trans isomerase
MKLSLPLLISALLGTSMSVCSAPPVIDPPVPPADEAQRVEPLVPVGKTLLFPITASDADGDVLSYKVTSSNPSIMVRAKTGNPKLTMTVSHAGGAATDPPYAGTMEFMLFNDWLPVSSGFVGGMAQAGFYDNVIFHRLADLGGGEGTTGFIFQGGDPLGTGGGGPGMTANDPQTAWKFQNEFHIGTLFTGRGQLAMANAGTLTGYSLGSGGTLIVPDYLDTNGSQFFITDGQPRHLDYKHNIFGQMLRGWELLPKLSATKTTSARPDQNVTITAANVVPNETDTVLVISAKAAGTALIKVTATDRSGATATRSFTVRAFRDTVNNNPFFYRNTGKATGVDIPAVFRLGIVDLEFDYLDVQHSMLPLSASIGPKGSLLASSGFTVQMQPNAGYTGLINMGLSVRQFDVTGGGFGQIADYTNAYVGAGEEAARPEGARIDAQPGLPLVNVVAGKIHDMDTTGAPGNFTAKINWGDGTPLSVATLVRDTSMPGSNTMLALGGHTYAKPGRYPVVVEFFGDRGLRVSSQGDACVTSAPLRAHGLELTLNSARVVNRVLATFADTAPAEASAYSAWIDWGDGGVSRGSISLDRETGQYLVRGTHGYIDSEPFTVRVRVHKANQPAATDAFAWSTLTPQFAAIRHLPPFPHGKFTIAWNSGPNKSTSGTPGPGYQVTLNGTFVIINTGNMNIPASKLRFWLSSDPVLNTTGFQRDKPVPVNGQPELSIIPFPAGAGGSGSFVLTLPPGESGGRKYLLSESVYSNPVVDGDGSDKVMVTALKPSILVSRTSGLSTTEAGGKATFTVLFDTPPTAAVTVPLESSLVTEGTVSPAQLVFNQDNWFMPQTVTVTGVNDATHDGNKSFQIKLNAATTTDTLYNGLVGPAVTVTNKDDDP